MKTSTLGALRSQPTRSQLATIIAICVPVKFAIVVAITGALFGAAPVDVRATSDSPTSSSQQGLNLEPGSSSAVTLTASVASASGFGGTFSTAAPATSEVTR